MLTTKSIGLDPREGYREPVYSQYGPGCFVNAVGLTNPGADKSLELLAELNIPVDRFLLTSIFGGSVEEFVAVAKILAPVSDGLELNLSCPHAKGYGMAMGQDPDLVREITAAVKAAVDIPVIPKLTPNTPDIAQIAEAAIAGGADGLCAINTLGPGHTSAHGYPVLSNGAGGLSGKGVLPIGLKCVREIAAVTDCPIIGCGGVSSADDVRAFFEAGASVVGVGSALTGLTTGEIDSYFKTLSSDLDRDSNRAESQIRYDIDMTFRPVTLVENKRVCEDIALLTFDRKINIQAGEFIFLWIPGLGEKPFSALTDDPFTLVVIDLGTIHPCADGSATRHRSLCARPPWHTRSPCPGCQKLWRSRAAQGWLPFTRSLGILAMQKCLPARAALNAFIISTNANKSPRYTLPQTMAVPATMVS